MEALAWYSSFHNHRDGDWGIYIPLSSLHLFDSLFLSDLALPRRERWRIAWDALLAHEQMHFLVDFGVGWLELLTVAPMRRSLWDRIKEPPRLGVSDDTGPDYLPSEEALANGFMLRDAGRSVPVEVLDCLKSSVKMQPEGYRDGESAATDEGFALAAAETFRNYLAVTAAVRGLDPANPGIDYARLLVTTDDMRRKCPVYVLNGLACAGLTPDAIRIVHSIPEIDESRRFKKSLAKLSDSLQHAWQTLKENLKERVPDPPKFEKLRGNLGGLFSLRLPGGYRVHLRQPAKGGSAWEAIDVGNHKEMGHG
jgi:hypothetical protein